MNEEGISGIIGGCGIAERQAVLWFKERVFASGF
jgi:hypothetical protein